MHGANMTTITSMDTISIGLNDGAWGSLSHDVAESLLRVCGFPGANERTYTNVEILPIPSGTELYVRLSFAALSESQPDRF
jgi:hypothetical protein